VEEKVLKLDRTGQPIAAAPPQAEPAPEAPESAPVAGPVADAVPSAQSSLPTSLLAPPAAPQVGNPDQRRDDRDQRGRRSRRRRGGKGRSGLPDSKFYSPGQRTGNDIPPPSAALVPEATPDLDAELESAPVLAAAEAEDFMVLPGESLAKYTAPAEEAEDVEEDGVEQEAQAEAEPVSAVAEPAGDEPPAVVAVKPVVVVEPEALGPVAEPVVAPPAVAAVALVAEPVVEPPAAVPMAPVAEPEPEAVKPVDEPEPEAVAGPEEAAVALSAEPEPESEVETAGITEAEAEALEEEAGTGEGPAEAEAEAESSGEAGETIVEDEGPEPARIPTSLTATLREQGPRYQHRVSRRTRRKGRDGRDGRDNRGPAPTGVAEATRPPEARPQPESRPEQRTAPARNNPEPRADKAALPSISDLLKEGQEIIVQIAKEPLGQKGARITSHIALPGRFLVYMPTVEHIGVSRKIPSDDERLRLKRILQANRTGIPGGYIVRTAGEGRSEEELRADMMFLYNMWLDMRQKAERKPAPLLIHHDLNVVERILRDQLTSSFKCIWVDNEEIYESVLRFVQRFQPGLVSRVKLYTRSTPIFDEFNITSELEKALRPKVWLKSGGYIVINQTEALVAIDINTGKYVGKSNRLEDTIVKTNTDAVKEIVRQIRLRDLGGIIVVDFIDMDERKNRQKVMQALEEAMRSDRAPNKILQFNDFGLVAITRKRVKQSLERTLCVPCAYCEGAGYVKSPQTLVGEILQEAHKISRAVEGKDVLLRVSPEVAKLLKSNQNTYLPELEEILGRPVIVKSDPLLHQEKFDLA
jgi:ribonuclease G